MKEKTAKIRYIVSVILFGLNPVFVRFIDLPSDSIALYRAVTGAVTLFIICAILKKQIDIKTVRKYFKFLLLAGTCLALNWLFLFEAYATIKVSVASLCNYMAPIIAVAISPFIIREKLGKKQIICILTALLGIIFVSGVLDTKDEGTSPFGIFIGMMAALAFVGCLYSNKLMVNISPFDSIRIQLIIAICIMLPYTLIKHGGVPVPADPRSIICILIMGILISGFAYLWYYGSMPYMSIQSIAVLGYIEPVVCIILSLAVFGEAISVLGGVGATLIIGAAIASERN